MFFIDTLDWCGFSSPSIVGCANRPGNDIVVESAFAAGGNGTELNAHELGHNLGLEHETFPNLMTSSINGNTTLTADQIATILASDLIQSDADGKFILITPIAVGSGSTTTWCCPAVWIWHIQSAMDKATKSHLTS